MDERPLILDLFCGAGGAGMGYHRAGFRVIGVDCEPMPNYPFEFYQMDAIEALETILRFGPKIWETDLAFGPDLAHRFTTPIAAIHTSPPCQYSSALTKGTNRNNGKTYVNLIPRTRELLAEINANTPIPTVIENVQGAEIRKDLTLCGEMFGLDVIRHRYFECNFPVEQPPHIAHRGRTRGWRHGEYFDGPYLAVYGEGGGKGTVAEWQKAMGIDWTDVRKEIAEAIPPKYCEFVGGQLMGHLNG